MLDHLVFPINTVRHILLYVHHWESPAISFTLYIALAIIAWVRHRTVGRRDVLRLHCPPLVRSEVGCRTCFP